MKHFQTVYIDENAFRKTVSEWQTQCAQGQTLFHIFSDGAEASDVKAACAVIDEMMPEATYVGSSASGCIYNGKITTEKLVISCTNFEKPDSYVQPQFFALDDGDAASFRKSLHDCFASMHDVKAVEVITTIDTIPIREVCQAIEQEIPENVPVWGGGAFGDNSFVAFVFKKGEPFHSAGVLMTFLGGSELYVQCAHVSGWKPLGYPLRVTRADGYVLHELDRHPAYQIYEHYLRIPNDDHIFYNALEFPFAVQHEDRTLLRHALSCDENGALTMSTRIPEGSTLHVTYGDPETIMQDVMQCAQMISDFSPDVISIFDCFGRKTFWGGTEGTREITPFHHIAPTYGLCTAGELIRWKNSIDHHNLTLVIAGLREGEPKKTRTKVVRKPASINESTMSMINRLVNFINTATMEVMEANTTLSLMAITDRLTKLYNRGEIQRRITERITEKKKQPDGEDATSLVMIDLDDFKHINDTYGHQEGDQVLMKISELIHQQISKLDIDASDGRWGGEEFMIMLPGMVQETAAAFAEKIRKEIEKLRFEKCGKISASFGVAQALPSEEPDPLVLRADTALYKAKAAGKNTVCQAPDTVESEEGDQNK
jgi:diguanylate cyclase (GGDEF)-like protein